MGAAMAHNQGGQGAPDQGMNRISQNRYVTIA